MTGNTRHLVFGIAFAHFVMVWAAILHDEWTGQPNFIGWPETLYFFLGFVALMVLGVAIDRRYGDDK